MSNHDSARAFPDSSSEFFSVIRLQTQTAVPIPLLPHFKAGFVHQQAQTPYTSSSFSFSSFPLLLSRVSVLPSLFVHRLDEFSLQSISKPTMNLNKSFPPPISYERTIAVLRNLEEANQAVTEYRSKLENSEDVRSTCHCRV
jgi:hypothetical protein